MHVQHNPYETQNYSKYLSTFSIHFVSVQSCSACNLVASTTNYIGIAMCYLHSVYAVDYMNGITVFNKTHCNAHARIAKCISGVLHDGVQGGSKIFACR
jgi:hypothetical protein